MMSTMALSSPETGTSPPAIRHAFTSPSKWIEHQQIPTPTRQTDGKTVETLYTHRAAKIVSFSPISSSPRLTSSSSARRVSADHEDEAVGTLPWASSTERTIAAGPLSIYRVQGSVAFLDSGETLRPMLPKSRCWCVDGESKFVLRIRQNAYYRIELPSACAEDKTKTEELKLVLANVLQYELTPCPFQRGFTVELPEPPKTPMRRRPWRPVQRSVTEEMTHVQRRETEEDVNTRLLGTSNGKNIARGQASDTTDDTGTGHNEYVEINQEEAFDAMKTPTRPKTLSTGRAITAPPQLTLKTTPPSNLNRGISQPQKLEAETSSLSSSIDSFHSFYSFHSPISPLPPSPPYSDPPSPSERSETLHEFDVVRTPQHKRDISELTVTTNNESSWDMATPKSHEEEETIVPLSPRTPALTDDVGSQVDELSPEIRTPSPSTAFRRRPLHSRRRTNSPLPSPTNLYSPRARISGHHLTTAILQKTCSLLLGPPAQLVALMLNVAAKITNGVRRGSSFGYGERGQRIPCAWDYSDTDDDAEDIWEEDDYGISLGRVHSSKLREFREIGGSWEID